MINNNLAGTLLKLYITEDPDLTQLLRNSGSMIVLYKDSYNSIYIGGQHISSGWGLSKEIDLEYAYEIINGFNEYKQSKSIDSNVNAVSHLVNEVDTNATNINDLYNSYNNLNDYVYNDLSKHYSGDISESQVVVENIPVNLSKYLEAQLSNAYELPSVELYNYTVKFKIHSTYGTSESKFDGKNYVVDIPIGAEITSIQLNCKGDSGKDIKFKNVQYTIQFTTHQGEGSNKIVDNPLITNSYNNENGSNLIQQKIYKSLNNADKLSGVLLYNYVDSKKKFIVINDNYSISPIVSIKFNFTEYQTKCNEFGIPLNFDKPDTTNLGTINNFTLNPVPPFFVYIHSKDITQVFWTTEFIVENNRDDINIILPNDYVISKVYIKNTNSTWANITGICYKHVTGSETGDYNDFNVSTLRYTDTDNNEMYYSFSESYTNVYCLFLSNLLLSPKSNLSYYVKFVIEKTSSSSKKYSTKNDTKTVRLYHSWEDINNFITDSEFDTLHVLNYNNVKTIVNRDDIDDDIENFILNKLYI